VGSTPSFTRKAFPEESFFKSSSGLTSSTTARLSVSSAFFGSVTAKLYQSPNYMKS